MAYLVHTHGNDKLNTQYKQQTLLTTEWQKEVHGDPDHPVIRVRIVGGRSVSCVGLIDHPMFMLSHHPGPIIIDSG